MLGIALLALWATTYVQVKRKVDAAALREFPRKPLEAAGL
jgi:hypothetical protein